MLDIFVPQDLRRDMLAPEFAIDRPSVGFDTPPVPLLRSRRAIKPGFRCPVDKGHSTPHASKRRQVSRTVEGATARTGTPASRANHNISRTRRICVLAVGILSSQKGTILRRPEQLLQTAQR